MEKLDQIKLDVNRTDGVVIHINGQDLLGLVHDAELRLGEPGLAGGYLGLSPERINSGNIISDRSDSIAGTMG